ncbi:MAG: ATP-dependent helicase UvrD/PcrA [Thermoleophilaceae bacterium]|nr:ATP-dependent helicase UvrD/PcrA [Thermoleophilaceae bacterium]
MPPDGLSEPQLRGVAHPAAPLLVLGGAGTGKSRVLCERFTHLVEAGSAPGAVLSLALSTEAAARTRESVETAIETPFEELWVETFQGFCARLLRDEALEAGLDPFFAPVTQADRLALLLERIDDLTLRRHEIRGNPAPLLASFLVRIDRLKEEMVSPAEYQAHAERLSRQAVDDADRARARRELEFAGLYADHDALLADRGALDSGGLVLHAFELLHRKPHVRVRVAGRFEHVLVDDFQDVTFSEAALLRLMTEGQPSITVAADDDQAIRRDGRAASKNVLDFQREHPDATLVKLERSQRCARRVVQAASAVVAPASGRIEKKLRGRGAVGEVRFWRCRSERAEAQQVAAEAERLIATCGVPAEEVCVLVPSLQASAQVVGSALEERGVPFRVVGSAAYFQRAEVRDALAWLRLLADPGDSGAVVRALTRPPVELRPVDVARLTQLSRRRKLDMVAGVVAALETPQLSPEGRDRAITFMRIYRSAARAYEEMPPDLFVHRLVERIGLRRQQVFAAQADTVERLVNIAKLSELATRFMRREPGASARDFTRYVAAVAEAGLPEEEASPPSVPAAVRLMSLAEAKGREFEHVMVVGLSAAAMPGPRPPAADAVPAPLLKERLPSGDAAEREAHEGSMRRLLHVAMTRARKGLVLSWPQTAEHGPAARPSPFFEEARSALGDGVEEEAFEEQLFGPAEGLHSTFRMMRDELLDSVSQVGGRLAEMRLDTYLDVSQAVVRYLELLKLAALIERARGGQTVDEALAEVNDLLLQVATSEQSELFKLSALDEYLRDSERDERRRREAIGAPEGETLEPFIPRRGDGLMLSASDLETYRICPLKYKFARVFRIPQEPTINQRFGILLHQVLERFHQSDGASLEHLMQLFEISWRRNGFGDSNDDLQFREKAVAALRQYWEDDREASSRPAWVERSFSFRLGPHLLRGRVDRVDRHPDGSYELIDYKTGRAKTADDLRQDIQLSIYQMGAREAWKLETSAQSYYYVLDGEKVPVEHSEEELERVRTTVAEIGDGIMAHDFEPRPSPEICPFCDYRIVCPAAEK